MNYERESFGTEKKTMITSNECLIVVDVLEILSERLLLYTSYMAMHATSKSHTYQDSTTSQISLSSPYNTYTCSHVCITLCSLAAS